MFENGFATRTESAKKCIFPVIHQLDALGDAAYGGRFYDGDMNVLHVNILPNARTNLAATLRTDFLTGEALTDFDKHIQFHVVKYSQAQMNTLQETVRKELMGHAGFGIHEVYYDTKRHKLIIGVDDASEEARGAILNELSRFGYTDADMVAIQNEPRAYTSGVFDFTGDPVDMGSRIAYSMQRQRQVFPLSPALGLAMVLHSIPLSAFLPFALVFFTTTSPASFPAGMARHPARRFSISLFRVPAAIRQTSGITVRLTSSRSGRQWLSVSILGMPMIMRRLSAQIPAQT